MIAGKCGFLAAAMQMSIKDLSNFADGREVVHTGAMLEKTCFRTGTGCDYPRHHV
jgi:hypothetical protein